MHAALICQDVFGFGLNSEQSVGDQPESLSSILICLQMLICKGSCLKVILLDLSVEAGALSLHNLLNTILEITLMAV